MNWLRVRVGVGSVICAATLLNGCTIRGLDAAESSSGEGSSGGDDAGPSMATESSDAEGPATTGSTGGADTGATTSAPPMTTTGPATTTGEPTTTGGGLPPRCADSEPAECGAPLRAGPRFALTTEHDRGSRRAVGASALLAPDARGPVAQGGTTSGADDNGDGAFIAESDDGNDDGVVFIQEPDGGFGGVECDTYQDDCPEGEKCMPWSNDGASAWNSTKCSPIIGDDEIGDECIVQGNGVSGVDSCVAGSMCWDTDEEGIGTCVEFCGCNAITPTCSDPANDCVIANDGVINLCLPTCDPLRPDDCPSGQGCYSVGGRLSCAPDASGSLGQAGDPCEFVNGCAPGLLCVGSSAIAQPCQGSGCCTPYCQVGSGTCVGGNACVPLFEGEDVRECQAHLGACLVP